MQNYIQCNIYNYIYNASAAALRCLLFMCISRMKMLTSVQFRANIYNNHKEIIYFFVTAESWVVVNTKVHVVCADIIFFPMVGVVRIFHSPAFRGIMRRAFLSHYLRSTTVQIAGMSSAADRALACGFLMLQLFIDHSWSDDRGDLIPTHYSHLDGGDWLPLIASLFVS